MKKRLLTRKSVCLFLCFLLLLVPIGCSPPAEEAEPVEEPVVEEPETKFVAGTYTATGPGRNGPITVEVTFSDDEILSAQVTENRETIYVSSFPIEKIPAIFVEEQTLAIDTISGATQTSNGVLAALKACVEQAGGDVNSLMTAQSIPPIASAVEECDVVVVGAGGAGIAAAMELKRAGLDVILLERTGVMGGTSFYASTYYQSVGTSVHEEKGVTTTIEEFANRLPPARLREGDPETALRFTRSVADMANWMIDQGTDLNRLIDGETQMGPSDGGTPGEVVIPALVKGLDDLGVDYRLDNRAVSIIEKDGAAAGVVVETKAGTYEIHSKAVILTAGGYLYNPELVEQYNPDLADYGTTWSVGSMGDGLLMAQELGAELTNMGIVVINPTGFKVGTGQMISLTPIRFNGGILVGRETGTRFANELSDYTAISSAMPDGVAYGIIDQQIVDEIKALREYSEYGFFVKGDTIEELAENLNLDPGVLRETVETYGEYARSGVDEEFGRTSMLSTLSSPPYYAMAVEPCNHNPVGGLSINYRGQVLKTDGSVIPGLYAAGNQADNTIAPNGIQGAVGFGMVVANNSIEDMK